MRRALVCALLLAAGSATARPLPDLSLARLAAADVVILGELHDNPHHHETQAALIAAIAPTAVVFEMLTPGQAARVTPELRGDREALEAVLGWEAAGWPDFAMYHPLFLAAPRAAIRGGAKPRADIRRAFEEGAAAVFGPDAGRFGLDMPLAPALQAEREAEMMASHCDAIPATLLPGMVEAQRLRDALLARAALDALDALGAPVVIIAGNGHARNDVGIPAHIRVALPELSVLAVGQGEGPAVKGAPFDLWIEAPPVARGDPCAAFRDGEARRP